MKKLNSMKLLKKFLRNVELGTGCAFIEITAPQSLYEDTLSEICGVEIVIRLIL